MEENALSPSPPKIESMIVWSNRCVKKGLFAGVYEIHWKHTGLSLCDCY